MEIPGYQPFYLDSIEGLRSEVTRFGLEIPIQEDLSPLAQPFVIRDRIVPNRFCAQPISGGDMQSDGSPGPLTRRRYRKYAAGSFGLIWVEKTSAVDFTHPGTLCLSRHTLKPFAALVEEIRAASPSRSPVIVIQIASQQAEAFVLAAKLAQEAGFDGIDVQGDRDLLPDTIARVHSAVPGLLLTTRLCAYEGRREGFGVSKVDFRKYDLRAPTEYVRRLVEGGLQLLNITSASPSLLGAHRGVQGIADSDHPNEHPLMSVNRQLALVRALRGQFPLVPIVGSGLSWLRHFAPQVAAGALQSSWLDFAGLGRAALACPDLPKRIFSDAGLEGGSTCMMCFACNYLSNSGRQVGCVVRDPEFYSPVYRDLRRLEQDNLMAGAARCHLCESAPCRAKSPTHCDIPSFIKTFRAGDEQGAFELIRSCNPLPELVSLTSPSWLEEEGACIETLLTGLPVPIQDLQYTIAWRARERGTTGLSVPLNSSGRRVAVIGGGPTGIAAATRVLEFGHQVHIHEASDSLGGVPVRLLKKTRSLSILGAEIDALLRPASISGRLQISYGKTLGQNIALREVLAQYDAVLVAVGLWHERSLGKTKGVVSGLEFLEKGVSWMPRRAAVLAGGDSAMDVCRTLRALGVADVYVVFPGPRSQMHWHMTEGWFSSPGVHAMMNWVPLGYETDQTGTVTGLRIRHSELAVNTVQPVDFVVESMGLDVAQDVLAELAANSSLKLYTAGAMSNGGASAGHCVAEGLSVADTIHQELLK
jgi:NADPH-dependent glutamate synthase beta subunit-like oxidoreductase/2,4-dienoyl-CoA reductase-like NADH-dependent reductase (Old Yellow Enzyme family)